MCRNTAYLLLAFPLGLAHFVIVVTGFTLGISLTLVGVGIPILLLTIEISRSLVSAERHLMQTLLDVNIPIVTHDDETHPHFLARCQAHINDPATWRGLLYLLLKLPLGLISFGLLTIWVSLSLILISAPFTYPLTMIDLGFTQVDTFTKALLCAIFGAGIALLGPYLVKILTDVWIYLGFEMLGEEKPKRTSQVVV